MISSTRATAPAAAPASSETSASPRARGWAGMRRWIWTGVASSRLLVVVAGIVGATAERRATGWRSFDPQQLTLSLGSVGNVLAASSDRWDAVHYVDIARHGYRAAGDTVFFPLYPLLIHVVAWLTRSDVLAGVLISTVAFLVALVLLHRLISRELDGRAADATVLLLCFAPAAFFFTAVYTESLFLSLSVATFYLARRGRFTCACLAAGAATLTHAEGIVLVAPLALIYLQGSRTRARRPLIARDAAVLLLPPLALLAFLGYLHTRGFGWLAPAANEAIYRVQTVGPLVTTGRAVSAGLSGLWAALAGHPHSGVGALDFVYLVEALISLGALWLAWRRLPKAYALYAALFLLVCTGGPVAGLPLRGFDRYTLMLFPLWAVAAQWLSERGLLRAAVATEAVLLCFFAAQFGHWSYAF